MHKSFPSGSIPVLQPTVSSIDTYNYKLAQYLGSLLLPHSLKLYNQRQFYFHRRNQTAQNIW